MTLFHKIFSNIYNTGERPLLNKKIEQIPNDIAFAYKFASKYIENKTVFDFGCGGGYGTEYLSRFTKKEVFGFDKNTNAIKTTNSFFHKDNLIFSASLPKKKFDVIVSFQVIEHIKDRVEYYKKLKKLLKPNGIILISTPNKNITSYGLKKPAMVFHEIEFDPNSLKRELSKHFNHVNIFGQISNSMKDKVEKNHFNYHKLVKSYSYRIKTTWWLSQFEIIRIISRHLPMFIKYLLMGHDKSILKTKYTLVTKKRLVDNSFILISELKD